MLPYMLTSNNTTSSHQTRSESQRMPKGQTVSSPQVIRLTLRDLSTYCCAVVQIKDASDQVRSPIVASELDSQGARVRAESQDSIKATSQLARKMLSTASLKLHLQRITTTTTTQEPPQLRYKNTHLSQLIMWSHQLRTVQHSSQVVDKNNKTCEL